MSKITFFWKPDGNNGGFSQWSDHSIELSNQPFAYDGESIIYDNAEQAMIAAKAFTFQDFDIIPEIMECKNLALIRRLGRKVKNFDHQIWNNVKEDIVYRINLAKFRQHTDLRVLLQNTGNDIIANASPYDKIWGIGLSENNIMVQNQDNWIGLNLLGKILQRVRNHI